MPGTPGMHVWNVAELLQGKEQFAMLLLNHAISKENATSLQNLWCKACVRVSVDGGTNDYYKYILHHPDKNCLSNGASSSMASINNNSQHKKFNSMSGDSIKPESIGPKSFNSQSLQFLLNLNQDNCKTTNSPGKNDLVFKNLSNNSYSIQIESTNQCNGKLYPFLHTGIPLPDFISGDFDSVDPKILQHFSRLGVNIIPTPEQDETDFTKALRELNKYLESRPSIQVSIVLVAVEISALRFDHVFGNINTLHKAQKLLPSLPVILLSGSSVHFLLSAGHHVISSPGFPSPEDNWCAYVPLSGPSVVSTKGLKWDVENCVVQFGGLVSTSNQFASPDGSAHISTDKPLLFIMGTPLVLADNNSIPAADNASRAADAAIPATDDVTLAAVDVTPTADDVTPAADNFTSTSADSTPTKDYAHLDKILPDIVQHESPRPSVVRPDE
ncbi:uncharacterized protein LOC108670900 isoform X1 [Hyalella azteca]|uniref:Uncharacterized protein LOC108670900 isoform X1 n=1 Tax=Hyalella azteca TaxID=294128 RepID=A0A8B7NJQ6_HYAAZ|nr:uncharacterized protein LOC108670900 isoform X1 [Hyalella azteca]